MASVVISVDAELAANSLPDKQQKHRARRNWLRLVDCFERHEIPATWAIVGRLCSDGTTLDAPPENRWFRSFADSDRSKAMADIQQTNRLLSGRSLVEAVIDSQPDHDVGSHSYSHLRYTDMTRELAAADLAAARAAMADMGIVPNSFVYPFNSVAHRSELAAHGFTCYRGTPATDNETVSSPTTWQDVVLDTVPERPKQWVGWAYDRLSEAMAYSVGTTPPPVVQPAVDSHGLVAVPASMPSLYRMPVRLRAALRATGRYPLARIAKMGIDAAQDGDGLFHLWFHPLDFHTEADFESLNLVLTHLDAMRQAGAVQIETMAEVAARYNTNI